MNKNKDLFCNYQKSFEHSYEASTSHIKKLELKLQCALKDRHVFTELKDIIFNSPKYPIFVYTSKMYKQEFLESFKEGDNNLSLQNKIGCILVEEMLYLDSIDINQNTSVNSDFYCIDDNYKTDINPNISFKHKYLAMQYYNPVIATKLLNSSIAYFNLYKKELSTLKNITLEDIPKIFQNLKSYHGRKYLLNHYLFDMTSNLKENTEPFFSTLDKIEYFVLANNFIEFKVDLDDIRIAFNFRNK